MSLHVAVDVRRIGGKSNSRLSASHSLFFTLSYTEPHTLTLSTLDALSLIFMLDIMSYVHDNGVRISDVEMIDSPLLQT